MDEEAKKRKAPSDNDSIDDPELMNLINDVKSTLDEDEEIIELTEVIDDTGKEPVSSESLPEESKTGEDSDIIIKALDDDLGIDDIVKDDFAASLGMKIETDPDFSAKKLEPEEIKIEAGPEGGSEKINISQRQIEDAIERVVQKMLGEKIDGILVKTIERAVSQEIIRLKNILRVKNEEEMD
jgi:hypothetical protein